MIEAHDLTRRYGDFTAVSGISLSVKEGEKVVIGTTTMRDKALIVVLTATVLR